MDVRMPDGTVIANVPDGTTQADLGARYQAHLGAQSQPEPTAPSLGDYARTNPVLGATTHAFIRGGQGIEQLAAHSAADLADLGGHAPNSLATVFHAIADHIDATLSKSEKDYQGAKTRVVNASTNPRVSNALIGTGETFGAAAQPTGMAGNLIESAPGVLNAAARGAVSGGAFAASQPVDSQDYWTEKVKQVGVGGLTGAVTGAAVEKLSQVKPDAGPKSSTFKELASDSYDASKATGATVPKSDFEAAINSAETKARDTVTYRPSLEPKAATAIDQIKKDLEDAGPNVTFEDMDVARRVARKVLTSPDKNERAVAHTIIDGIDDYIGSLNSKEGDALTTARDLFARGSKLDTIERLVTKAQDSVGANQTRTKLDNAIRQQFKSLKGNVRAFSQFDPQEQKAIKLIVDGKPIQNAARWIGKVSPTTGGPILGELLVLGHSVLQGSSKEAAGIIGLAGAGLAGQHVADTMGNANVTALKNIVAGRNALPAPRPSPNAFVRNVPANFAINALLQPRAQ